MAATDHVADLQLDQDLQFQRRDGEVQRVAWFVMLLILAAALLGLLGGTGALSSARAEADGISVDYLRFNRHLKPEIVVLHIQPPADADEIRLWINQDYLHSKHLQGISPEPSETEAGGDRVVYVFALETPGQPVDVSFSFRPAQPGLFNAEIGLDGASSVTFSQVIYP